jgi:hypothetical protein
MPGETRKIPKIGGPAPHFTVRLGYTNPDYKIKKKIAGIGGLGDEKG